MKLLVAFYNMTPWSTSTIGKDRKIGGLIAPLVSYISTSLNFSYDIADIIPQLDENGERMFGIPTEVDLVMSPIYYSMVPQNMHHTVPYYVTTSVIISGKIPLPNRVFLSYVSSLHGHALLFIISTFVVFALFSYFVELLRHEQVATKTPPLTASDHFWIFAGAMLYQSCSKKMPHVGAPFRVLIFFWWVACMMFIGIFASNHKALLTSGGFYSKIDSARDLLEHPAIMPIIPKPEAYFFKKSLDRKDHLLYRRLEKEKCIVETYLFDLFTETHLKETREGRAAIMSERTLAVWNILKNWVRPDSFYISREPFRKNYLVMAVHLKHHHLLPRMNRRILQFVEGGHMELIFRQIMTPVDILLVDSDPSILKSISLESLKWTFLTWFLCLLISTTVLTAECLAAGMTRKLGVRHRQYYLYSPNTSKTNQSD